MYLDWRFFNFYKALNALIIKNFSFFFRYYI